jgi:hypothetical protein
LLPSRKLKLNGMLAEKDLGHGTAVASKVNGDKLGICKNCAVIMATRQKSFKNPNDVMQEDLFLQLTDVIDDIVTKKRVGKAVINMSFVIFDNQSPAFSQNFRKYSP